MIIAKQINLYHVHIFFCAICRYCFNVFSLRPSRNFFYHKFIVW